MDPYIVLAIILILIVVILYYLNSASIECQLNQEVNRLKSSMTETPNKIITEDDLEGFPILIQSYLKYCGVVGKEQVYNARMKFKGLFRMNPNQPWFKTKTIQFNYLPDPTRLFFMKLYLFKILSMIGKDTYFDGTGHMKGKFMRFIPLMDEKGKEFDIGELTTFLNDTVLLCPAGLITLKRHLQWKELDDQSIEVTLTHRNLKVRATLYFNEDGQLSNYKTTDRFYDTKDENKKKKYVQTLWSTPVDKYKEINGQMIVTEAMAIWHLETGDLPYAKFTLETIEYNIKI